MGANRRCGSIVLVVFDRVGIGIGELQNFELVVVGEENHWSDNGVDILHQDLVYHFQFADVSLEV